MLLRPPQSNWNRMYFLEVLGNLGPVVVDGAITIISQLFLIFPFPNGSEHDDIMNIKTNKSIIIAIRIWSFININKYFKFLALFIFKRKAICFANNAKGISITLENK